MNSTASGLAGKRLVITGVNGFLGVHAGIMALKTGATVIGLDLPGSFSGGDEIRASLGGGKIPCKGEDLSRIEGWKRVIRNERPEIIIHLAGSVGRGGTGQDWAEHIKGNFLTTSCLIQSISALPKKERPVVVCPGSQLEYGTSPMPWTENTLCRPAGSYATSKLLSTELLLSVARSGTCTACAARFPIIYGPGQLPTMFIPELIRDALVGVDFKMTAGRQRRRFTYITDAASFLLSLAAGLIEGLPLPALINAPSTGPISMREIAERIVDRLGHPIALEIGALPMREHEVLESWPVDSLATSLGYSCGVALDEGLGETVEWYRKNPQFWEGSAR